jgi:hypothetical protein
MATLMWAIHPTQLHQNLHPPVANSGFSLVRIIGTLRKHLNKKVNSEESRVALHWQISE